MTWELPKTARTVRLEAERKKRTILDIVVCDPDGEPIALVEIEVKCEPTGKVDDPTRTTVYVDLNTTDSESGVSVVNPKLHPDIAEGYMKDASGNGEEES